MTLVEIRRQLEEWKVNPKEEHNQYLDLFIALVDHLISVETSTQELEAKSRLTK